MAKTTVLDVTMLCPPWAGTIVYLSDVRHRNAGLRWFQTPSPEPLELRDELPRRGGRWHLMTFRVTIVGRLWCHFPITAPARQRHRFSVMLRLPTGSPAWHSCCPRKRKIRTKSKPINGPPP